MTIHKEGMAIKIKIIAGAIVHATSINCAMLFAVLHIAYISV